MEDNNPKPTKVVYFWKRKVDPMGLYRDAGLKSVLDYNTDNNGVLAGIQNPFRIEGIPFDTLNPTIDLLAVGITADGKYSPPGFWTSGFTVAVNYEGGLDGIQTNVVIDDSVIAASLEEGEYLETPSGEIMRVESNTDGGATWTLVVERGAHATDKASVLDGGLLELLTPRCGIKRITLVGNIDPLDPPTMNTPNGIGEGILLTWDHDYTDAEQLRLKSWNIYYSDVAAIDIESAATYDGVMSVDGVLKDHVFNPIDSGFVDANTTFYFAMTSVTTSVIESTISNEVSGKVFGSITPNPDGPFTPAVDLVINGKFRLLTVARKPTGTNSALGVADAASVEFELYFAAVGEGVPTTDAGQSHANQTFVGEFNDTAVPYQYEKIIDSYGWGEFWARARITDGASQVGSWGLSDVLELTDESNTTDTGVSTGVNVDMVVMASSSTSARTFYLSGINCSGNFDSAIECQIAFRVDGVGTFEAGETLPFTGATASESTPLAAGHYPALFGNTLSWENTWEVTARIRNAFGWTDWITPEAITLSKTNKTIDTDVCALDEFGAWTQANPYPGATPGNWPEGIPEPGGEQVTFTFKLPTGSGTNSNSVWVFGIEGTKAASFPTETVLLNNTARSMVADAGTYEVTIAGYTATLNEFADKFLRKGLAIGKNTTDILQVFQIASNTAGDPFVITLTGTETIRNLAFAGTVTEWEIVEKPIWSLLDFYTPVSPEFDHLGALAPTQANFIADVTGLKFRMQVHNLWGLGAHRESNTTAAGSTTPGAATYKSISGIDSADIKTGAIIEAKIGAGAVTPAKAAPALIPIGHTIKFTATDYRSFSWIAGDVFFAGGTDVSLGASSSGNLSTNTAYFISFDPSSPGGGLTITTDPETALANGKVMLGIAQTTSDTDEFCTIIPRWGEGINIGAQNIVAENVSAIFGSFGTMNAGTINGCTIQTSATATDDGGIVLNGTDLNIYNSDRRLLKLDEGGLEVYSAASGANRMLALTEAGLFVYPTTGGYGGIKIVPYNVTSAQMQFVNNLTTVGTFITAATSITLAMAAGLDFVITGATSNIALSAAGNLELRGTHIDMYEGGATTYFKIRDTNGSTKYVYSEEGVWTVAASAP